jgi:hypothetical protein
MIFRLLHNTYTTFALASTVFLAVGCTKEKLEDCPGQCTLITGHLVTSGLQPLAAVTVTANWHSGLSFASPRTKARATTDATGNYQVRFYVKDDELHDGYFELTYGVDKDRYYLLGNTDSPDVGSGSIKRDTTYHLAPFLIPHKAFVQLTVPNPSQIQSYFSVDFSSAHLHTLTATKQFSGGGAVVGIPKQNDPFTTLVEIAGDQIVYVRARRNPNYGTTSTVDSLVVPAGTTRALTIRY